MTYRSRRGHRELKLHGIWDDNVVPIRVVLILNEQFEGIGLLLGLLGGLLGDCVGHIIIIIVVVDGVG